MNRSIVAAFGLFLAALGVDAAADDMKLQSIDGTVTFSGSFGLTAIKAHELVYGGGGRRVSRLTWESETVSTINGAVEIDLPQQWYLRADTSFGFAGDGFMADYDWMNPGQPWTHRSQHPDTRLTHYIAARIEVGRDILSYDGTDLGVGAGFKYTDVRWTAWGGSFIYSSSGFRDSRGDFADDEKGISYRQSWPVPYLGINLDHASGPWTFSSALQGGVAIGGRDIDDHWVRSLRFYDRFEAAPALALSGSVNYAVWNNASVFLSGSLEQIFRAEGDTEMVDTTTGGRTMFRNGAGGDFRSMTVSFGLKGKF
jgi:omptin